MHTPIEVTDRALAFYDEREADCVVSFGGGSTIGLGKAIAWRHGARHLVVATTFDQLGANMLGLLNPIHFVLAGLLTLVGLIPAAIGSIKKNF